MMRTTKIAVTALAFALLLSGCLNVGDHRATLETAGDRIETAREMLTETPVEVDFVPTGAKAVEIPKDQAWLYRPIGPVDYHMSLRDAVGELVSSRPASYRMALAYNPVVKSPPDARTLKDHLDSMAMQANVGWHYEAGGLVFTAMVTRQYRLPVFGGAINTASISANNLGAGAGGGTGSDNTFSMTTHLSGELQGLVGATLGIKPCQNQGQGQQQDQQQQQQREQGSGDEMTPATMAGVPVLKEPEREEECYTLSPAANLLTITARPQTLLRFEEAYDPFLKGLKRSALLKIITIKLDVTDLTQQRLDLDLVRSGSRLVGGGPGGTLIQNITSDLTSSQTNLEGGLGAVFSATFVDAGSPWNGSSLLLQSLESITNVTVEDSRELLAYSNRLITIQDTERFNYVSQIQRDPETVGQTTTVRTSISTDQVVTGQALNILPSLSEDTISLHIVINEATLLRLKVDGTGDTRISLPDTANSDVVFDVTLGDNQTALIASTIRSETSLNEDKSGIIPLPFLDRLLSNSNEGQQRIYQTVYLIEARFQDPVPLS